MSSKQILCTLGPSSLNAQVIGRLSELGVSLFRVNLSHTLLEDVSRVIDLIQDNTDVPICIDTKGAQVRTGSIEDGSVEVHDNTLISISFEEDVGNSHSLPLYPADTAQRLEAGDLVSIDFNMVLLQVVERRDDGVEMRVLNGGLVGQNKAVTIERQFPLPPLTDKDKAAVEIARSMGVVDFALSFTNTAQDVDELRSLTGRGTRVISKIECRNGIHNLEEIAKVSDALLIDRGDLSREVPLEHIPATQKLIISKSRAVGIPVYVATNLLESMVSAPAPTRAEVNDIYNTLQDGADGLVLAAETAIGEYPVRCASMIRKMVNTFEQDVRDEVRTFRAEAISMLPDPHGGVLVQQEAYDTPKSDIVAHRPIVVDEQVLIDCFQLAAGTYSPLKGFMTRLDVESVLRAGCLSNDLKWPLPIVLPVAKDVGALIGVGERICVDSGGGVTHAVLDVQEVFSVSDILQRDPSLAEAVAECQTLAASLRENRVCIAGRITMVRPLTTPYRHLELGPAQTRFVFAHKGWSQVVAFHTRSIVHRPHEAMHLNVLRQLGVDGLFVSPALGPRRKGELLQDPVVRSYEAALRSGIYPSEKVVLGALSTYPRGAGRREMAFHALCSKNAGCSHVIVDAGTLGVVDRRDQDSFEPILESLAQLGIKPVFATPDEHGDSLAQKNLRVVGGPLPSEDAIADIVRNTLQSTGGQSDPYLHGCVSEVLAQAARSGETLLMGDEAA